MSMRLNNANPSDKTATVVCKTISLVVSIFMGRFLLYGHGLRSSNPTPLSF
jgi:hypothetical protein